MAYNFQSNYTKKIRQICSRVIFVHIVLLSCNFPGYLVSKLEYDENQHLFCKVGS